jgi:hypothetical protein
MRKRWNWHKIFTKLESFFTLIEILNFVILFSFVRNSSFRQSPTLYNFVTLSKYSPSLSITWFCVFFLFINFVFFFSLQQIECRKGDEEKLKELEEIKKELVPLNMLKGTKSLSYFLNYFTNTNSHRYLVISSQYLSYISILFTIMVIIQFNSLFCVVQLIFLEFYDRVAELFANRVLALIGIYLTIQFSVLARLTSLTTSLSLWIFVSHFQSNAIYINIYSFYRMVWIDFNWDIMEPVTYFVTFGTLIFGFAFFTMTKIDYSYPAFKERIIKYCLQMFRYPFD